jgi:predicted  nucleic acid-binding Zn-ribbon protein
MSQTQEERFNALRERKQQVAEKAVKINVQIENAQERLKKLSEEAERRFGKSDLESLKIMAQQWKDENESRLAKYEEEIIALEKEVNEKSELIKQTQEIN